MRLSFKPHRPFHMMKVLLMKRGKVENIFVGEASLIGVVSTELSTSRICNVQIINIIIVLVWARPQRRKLVANLDRTKFTILHSLYDPYETQSSDRP